MSEKSTLYTVGALAERLGVGLHQVTYVIASRGLEPLGRAGRIRLFGSKEATRIEAELSRIRLRRGKRHA